MKNDSEITEYVRMLSELSCENNHISSEMYEKHHVFRGLRDLHGNGVVTGLTEISRIKSKEIVDGVATPCQRQLY